MNPAAPESGGRLAIDLGSAPSTPAPKHPIPAIPDHELLRCIGHGSYGEVWLARTVLGECRAVKVVFRCAFGDNRPFEREFEGIQRYEPVSRSHPSQVQILHVGINPSGGYFYYVMELADDARGNPKAEIRDPKETPEKPNDEGRMTKAVAPDFVIRNSDLYTPRTLRQELERHDRLPLAQCIQIGLELTTALEHLHRHGLVHRDVKPSNIIFVGGVPKLADIGLVTEAGDGKSIVGTEGYLAPEGPGSASADLYSLGKVLYEISTGRDRRHFPDLPPDLEDWPDRQGLLELNEVLLKACATDSRQRYPTAAAMRADLDVLQRGESVRRKRVVQRRLGVAKKIVVAVGGPALVVGTLLLAQPSKRHKAPNPEVTRLYNLARLHLDKTTREGKLQALDCIERALKLDPKFAPGYATMLEISFWVGLVPDEDAKVRECARKLIEIDDKLPEGHAALSWIKFRAGDFQGSEAELRQAIHLNPSYALAHWMYGYSLALLGRIPESHVQYQRAQELNPTSREIATGEVNAFLAARQYDQALEHLRKALLLDPNYGSAHEDIAEIYEDLGRYPEAMEEWEKAEILDGQEPAKVLEKFKPLRQAYSVGGARDYWLKKRDLREVLVEGADYRQLPGARSYFLAKLYAHLGDKKQALDYLEKARAEGHRTVELRIEPCWDAVWDDPRFQKVLKQAGLAK